MKDGKHLFKRQIVACDDTIVHVHVSGGKIDLCNHGCTRVAMVGMVHVLPFTDFFSFLRERRENKL